ncbi:hypothetical protein [Aeromonas veronii]|uniref:hypothetical protein n=1 Tax=Aeromonas veronii TaxID=654 RepID=UPI0033080470|nr:hypothetical protein [Aeromonas veronii]HDO1355913.1 hypothetical protein [Aeromonas veronii]
MSIAITLHPSLVSANQLRPDALAPGSVHLNMEDTSFICNFTFGLHTVTQVAEATSIPLSFHLMLANPFPYNGSAVDHENAPNE